MRAALVLSRSALPACRPNPPVGCVITDGDWLVSHGFTGPPGEPHAEAMALAGLARVSEPAKLSAFVTLEPCSFRGRTPSCAQALIDVGVGAVYVGVLDPDRRNDGNGVAMLREAGIAVEVGILAQDVERFIGPYLGTST